MKQQPLHLVLEKQILKVICPVCRALPGVGCRTTKNRNIPLAVVVGSNKLEFHEERAKKAEEVSAIGKFTAALPDALKSQIVTYAFVMMADSVAVHSFKMMGKEFSTEEVQAHFVRCAIDELKKEGIIDDGSPSNTRRIIH